jgi:hypothetical protein
VATHFGTGLIETRSALKMPKLEKALEGALEELGYKQVYAGKEPPEVEPEEETTSIELLAGGDVLGIRINEDRSVRDVARHVSKDTQCELLVLMTSGALYGRRSVEVICRKFEVDRNGEETEHPVMDSHTAEVTDIEHNELRALDNAIRSRLNGANDSLLAVEATEGLKVKKVYRYRRELKKAKFSNPRLARLLGQLEKCEHFEVHTEGDRMVVKFEINGMNGMSYLKPDELGELEAALDGRPELAHRRRE